MTDISLGQPVTPMVPKNIVQVLGRACEIDPAAPALIFDDGCTVSRGDLRTRVETFAGYLHSRLQPGERIVVMLGNRTEWMVVWFAAAGCRVTVVSLNPAAKEHDAGHILRDSEAHMVITDADHADLFRGLGPECPALDEVVVVTDTEPDGLAGFAATPMALSELAENACSDDIINVYYTSGTTGVPKGCMVDHRYWLRFIELFQGLYGMTAEDRLICCLQFFYNDPPWHTLLSLIVGAPLVVMRRFSVSRFWDVVRANDVTILFGIASTANLLLKAPPTAADREHKVRLAVHVGIPQDLHAQLVQRWGAPWVEGYGLTETGMVAAMPVDQAAAMIGSGSIGRACPGVDIRIVDDQDDDVPVGAVGEIAVRAPGLMAGYLNRPEATAEAMRGGWFHTGDLGRADPDGYLYFQGRKKDVIRRSGENIAAAEVEQVLRSHPAVLECAVIPAPDELRGEEVHAVVTPASATVDTAALPAELVRYCAERLAEYKVPRYISLRADDFPRTPSMRVKKEEIRDTVPQWDREQELGWVINTGKGETP